MELLLVLIPLILPRKSLHHPSATFSSTKMLVPTHVLSLVVPSEIGHTSKLYVTPFVGAQKAVLQRLVTW